MQWNADPDEAIVIRCMAEFATGAASGVAGQRSFRDGARNDISHELTGWPTGPEFRLHTKSEQKTQRRKRGLLAGVNFVAELAAETLGGPPADLTIGIPDPPQEPANEVDDFPVIWADPGTWARTVPWQLDPARRPKEYAVQLLLTERRLVFLGGTQGNENADLLHTIPRECLVKGEQMIYSPSKQDLRISFFDGSWIRLSTLSKKDTARIAGYLNGELRPLRESDLTPAQRDAISEQTAIKAKLLKLKPERLYPPYYTPLGQGYVRADVPYPAKLFGHVNHFPVNVGPQGEKGEPPGAGR